MSNYIYYDMWNKITYPFPNFNGADVEDGEWIFDFIPHYTRAWDCIYTLELKLNHVSKWGSWWQTLILTNDDDLVFWRK